MIRQSSSAAASVVEKKGKDGQRERRLISCIHIPIGGVVGLSLSREAGGVRFGAFFSIHVRPYWGWRKVRKVSRILMRQKGGPKTARRRSNVAVWPSFDRFISAVRDEMDSEERGSVFPHLVRLSESFVSFYLYLTSSSSSKPFFLPSIPGRRNLSPFNWTLPYFKTKRLEM